MDWQPPDSLKEYDIGAKILKSKDKNQIFKQKGEWKNACRSL
jgi:hypothetical protein